MEEERPDRKRGMSAGGKAVLAICIVLAVLFILFFVLLIFKVLFFGGMGYLRMLKYASIMMRKSSGSSSPEDRYSTIRS